MPAFTPQVWQQRAAIQRQVAFQRAAGQFHQGGQQVDGGYRLAHPVRLEAPGGVDQQRHAGGHFEPVHLVPEAALAKHVAVVAGEHDQRVVGQAAFLQGPEQRADLRVDVAAGAEVGAAGVADLVRGQRLVPQVDHLEQALRVRVLLVLRQLGLRQRDVLVAVQVPVLAGDGVGIVGMGQRHGQAERLLGAHPHMVVEVLARLEHHFLVEIQLVGAHAGPGLQHRGHVVVPARAHLRLVPVHRPAVVGRVDVAGQALLVAVQLVRAAEVHLARQRRAVAEAAQVMGIGGHVGGKVGGVVVGPDLRRQLPAHQSEARGRAERAVAVGRIEYHALGGEPRQVRHLDWRGRVEGQQRRGHLVGHDEEDVGAFHRSLIHTVELCESAGNDDCASDQPGKPHGGT
ncbi:hypothetical protein FQZ97_346690 [compost metagenome]